MDGLEQKLKDQKKSDALSNSEEPPTASVEDPGRKSESAESAGTATASSDSKSKRPVLDPPSGSRSSDGPGEIAVYSPSVAASESSPGVQVDALLDTYFSRFHSKPYHILDESSVRQRLQLNQLPSYLEHAIYAVAARYVPPVSPWHPHACLEVAHRFSGIPLIQRATRQLSS